MTAQVEPMRTLVLLFLLTLPAVAQTPEEIVGRVYQTHKDNRSFAQTIKKCESCFTPGFQGVIERAIANYPGQSMRPILEKIADG